MMKKKYGENTNLKQKHAVKLFTARFLFFLYLLFFQILFSQEVSNSTDIKVIGGAQIISLPSESNYSDDNALSKQKETVESKNEKKSKILLQKNRIAKKNVSKTEQILKNQQKEYKVFFVLSPNSIKYNEEYILNHTLSITLNNSSSSKVFVKEQSVEFNFLFEGVKKIFFQNKNLQNSLFFIGQYFNKPPPFSFI